MTRQRKIFIIIIGLHFSIFSFGQIAPSGLGSKNIQQEILDHTRTYDSLVLFNKSGFWNNNDVVKGFLFKKDGCYKVSILFRKKNELDFIKKINIEKEQVNDTIKVFLTTNTAEQSPLIIQTSLTSTFTISWSEQIGILID